MLSNYKKGHAAVFIVLSKTTFKIDVFVPLVPVLIYKKNKKKKIKKNKKKLIYKMPDLVNEMTLKQKRLKKFMLPGESQDVLCLLSC